MNTPAASQTGKAFNQRCLKIVAVAIILRKNETKNRFGFNDTSKSDSKISRVTVNQCTIFSTALKKEADFSHENIIAPTREGKTVCLQSFIMFVFKQMCLIRKHCRDN